MSQEEHEYFVWYLSERNLPAAGAPVRPPFDEIEKDYADDLAPYRIMEAA